MKLSQEETNSYLKKIFYDLEMGGFNKQNLKNYAMSKGIPSKAVDEWYSKQEVAQLHKPVVAKNFYPIVGELGHYNVDLTFYEQYKTKNKGYFVILTCIEITTRRAYARILKNKSAKSVAGAMQEIIEEATKWTPFRVVFSDQGSEFQNEFKSLLKKNGIEYYSTNSDDHRANGMIERFNRTLRGRIERYMTANNTLSYHEQLQKIVENYNNTVHSSIKTTPNKATRSNEIQREIQAEKQEQITETAVVIERFELGQKVRRFRPRDLLEKKAKPAWFKTIYTVSKLNPFSYRIISDDGKEIKRTFQHYQLQSVADSEVSESVEERKTKEREKEEKKAKRDLRIEKILKSLDAKKKNIHVLSGRPVRKRVQAKRGLA